MIPDYVCITVRSGHCRLKIKTQQI